MRLFRLFPLLLTGILLVLFTISLAQDRSSTSPPASDPANQEKESKTPIIRSTASLVILDVVVTHNDHPVTNLQQQSFHIFEDGREQTIKTFEEHGPGRQGPKIEKAPALPPDIYTNVPDPSTGSAINLLLLDAVNTPVQDQAYARHKIIEYLKTVPPGTRLAIFTLASRLRLVQGFTTDSAVLLAALNKGVPMPSAVLPGTTTGESAASRFIAIGADRNMGVTQDSMDSVIASLNQFQNDEEANLLDRRVQITLDALKQLAVYLGALPGRKNVIWFSAAFPLSVTPKSPMDTFSSLRQYTGQLQEISDLLTASRVAVYPIDARGLITRTSAPTQIRPAARPIGGGGRSGMIDINAFPSAPAQSADRENAELATMLQLAEQTGGTPFYNSNAIKQAIAKAVENGSSYYTLSYSPENKNFDASFRKVQVKLAGHDYHLAYRRGYFADAPKTHSANALLGLDFPALRPDAPPSSQILFHARVLSAGDPTAQDLPPQPGPAGDLATKLKPPVKRYWIEYTADMHQVSADVDPSGAYRSNIEFIVIAYDRNGKVVNAGRRSFKMGIPSAKYDDVLRTGFSVRNELDLPDGEFWLRLAVHDVAADRIGSIEVPLKSFGAKTD